MRHLHRLGIGVVTCLALAAIPTPSPTALAAQAAASTYKVVELGDSIGVGGVGGDPADPAWHWQTTLSSLCTSTAGVTCVNDNRSVSGTKCSYWPSLIDGIMASAPDVVILACGTNDRPEETLYGEPATSWSVRYTLERIHADKPNTLVVVALPMLQDPTIASDYDINKMPTIEDEIYANTTYYINAGWPVRFANLALIPATGTYVVADGTHPLPRGYAYIGRLVYDAVAILAGWPVATTAMCDYYGHLRRDPRPVGGISTPCLT